MFNSKIRIYLRKRILNNSKDKSNFISSTMSNSSKQLQVAFTPRFIKKKMISLKTFRTKREMNKLNTFHRTFLMNSFENNQQIQNKINQSSTISTEYTKSNTLRQKNHQRNDSRNKLKNKMLDMSYNKSTKHLIHSNLNCSSVGKYISARESINNFTNYIKLARKEKIIKHVLTDTFNKSQLRKDNSIEESNVHLNSTLHNGKLMNYYFNVYNQYVNHLNEELDKEKDELANLKFKRNNLYTEIIRMKIKKGKLLRFIDTLFDLKFFIMCVKNKTNDIRKFGKKYIKEYESDKIIKAKIKEGNFIENNKQECFFDNIDDFIVILNGFPNKLNNLLKVYNKNQEENKKLRCELNKLKTVYTETFEKDEIKEETEYQRLLLRLEEEKKRYSELAVQQNNKILSFSIYKIKQLFIVKSPLNRKIDTIYKTYFPNDNLISSVKGSIAKMRAIEIFIENVIIKDLRYVKQRNEEYMSAKKKIDQKKKNAQIRITKKKNSDKIEKELIKIEKNNNKLYILPKRKVDKSMKFNKKKNNEKVHLLKTTENINQMYKDNLLF